MKYFQENALSKLSATERTVIDYLENNASSMGEITISQLSKLTFVSTGAISRLARRAGYTSFKDLCLYIAKESVRQQIDRINEADNTVQGVIQRISAYNRHSLDTTASSLKPDEIEIMCRLVLGSKSVFTYGIGSSYFAAMHLEHNLSIMNISARQMASIHDLMLWTNLKHKDRTVVILFSHTLQTKEILDVIKLCAKYQLMTVVITCNAEFKESNKLIKIRYNSYEGVDQSALKTITAKTAQLYIVDVVTAILASRVGLKPKISRKDLL